MGDDDSGARMLLSWRAGAVLWPGLVFEGGRLETGGLAAAAAGVEWPIGEVACEAGDLSSAMLRAGAGIRGVERGWLLLNCSCGASALDGAGWGAGEPY